MHREELVPFTPISPREDFTDGNGQLWRSPQLWSGGKGEGRGETKPVNQRNAEKKNTQVRVWKRWESFRFGFTDAFHPCAPA